MLICTARLRKTPLLLGGLTVLAAILIALFAFGHAASTPELPVLTSNGDRVAYLESLGWQVEPEAVETLQFLLPDPLTDAYQQYNVLQKEQGFDLSAFCGQQLTRYTYTVTNYPDRPRGVQLNLYLCGEQPVAGDVVCAGADGFQTTLDYPEEASDDSTSVKTAKTAEKKTAAFAAVFSKGK